MDFSLLGPVEAQEDGQPIPLGGPRQRALLARLLVDANRAVSVERLAADLWDAPPQDAHGALQNQVSRLRKVLGERLATKPPGYLIRVEPGELDLDEFRSRVAEAGAAVDPRERSRLLREADALFVGQPLADVDAPFAEAERAALEELRLAACEGRVDADLERGRHAELVPELGALVRAHPLRERLRGQLILALYRCGRQADALEAYRETRRMLDEELGLEPSPALRELERAILCHDPALAIRAPSSAAGAPEPTRPRGRRPRLIAIVLAALAAIGAAGASVVLLSDSHGAKPPAHTLAAGAPAPPVAATHVPVHRRHQVPGAHTVTQRVARPPVTSGPTVKVASRPAITIVETTSAPPPATTHPTVTRPRHTAKPVPPKPEVPPKPVTVSDAFDSDYVDPTIWHQITTGGDVSVAEQGGQLQLTVGRGAVPGGTYNIIDVHVGTQCSFPGNFDARVDYTLLEWPAKDNIEVGLNAIYANAAVMRVNSSEWGDEYGSWVIPSNGSVAIPETSGSMRIARVNGVETTYFAHDGTWRKLASATQGGAAVFGLQAMSDGRNPFGGQEVKVAFDNFTVTGVRPMCAPGAQPGG